MPLVYNRSIGSNVDPHANLKDRNTTMTTSLPYELTGIDAAGYACYGDPGLGHDPVNEEIRPMTTDRDFDLTPLTPSTTPQDDADFELDPETDDETDEDDACTCITCSAILPDDHDDDSYGEECEACYAKSHFYCLECESDYELEERSPKNACLCQSCQETKDEEIAAERLEAAKEAAQEAFDAILETEDLAVILKAMAALKRLAPKS
jgi:hypothetical protein